MNTILARNGDAFDFFNNLNYHFNRPMLERQGYYLKEKEGKIFVWVNGLGLEKDDVEITVEPTEHPNRQILSVTGSTKDEVLEKEHRINCRFSSARPIQKVDATFRNGFIILEVEFEEPVKPNVQITKQ